MKNGSNRSDSDKYNVNKKSLFVMFILLFFLVILVIGVSYQVYLYTTEGKSLINQIIGKDNDIFKNGSATIVYNEGENGILLENAIPMADSEGMTLSNPNQLMDFTVDITINRSSSISYEVVAEKDPSSTIDEKYIKLYVQKSLKQPTYEESVFMPTTFDGLKEADEYGAPAGSMILDRMNTSESISSYYRLRMWLDSSYPLNGNRNIFKIKVNVYGKGERIKN